MITAGTSRACGPPAHSPARCAYRTVQSTTVAVRRSATTTHEVYRRIVSSASNCGSASTANACFCSFTGIAQYRPTWVLAPTDPYYNKINSTWFAGS